MQEKRGQSRIEVASRRFQAGSIAVWSNPLPRRSSLPSHTEIKILDRDSKANARIDESFEGKTLRSRLS